MGRGNDGPSRFRSTTRADGERDSFSFELSILTKVLFLRQWKGVVQIHSIPAKSLCAASLQRRSSTSESNTASPLEGRETGSSNRSVDISANLRLASLAAAAEKSPECAASLAADGGWE